MRLYKGIQITKKGRYIAYDSKWYVGTYDSLTEALVAKDNARRHRLGITDGLAERRKITRLEGLQSRIGEAMANSNLDMREISRRSGISLASLYSYRDEGVQPKAFAIAKLAIVLHVSSDWLLGIENEGKSNDQ